MQKSCYFFLVIWLILALTGCTADNTQTAAQNYLDNHSEEDITAYFEQATFLLGTFESPNQISTSNLHDFALLHEKESRYNEEQNLFYIPLADIYEILDNYLDEYHFQTEWVQETYKDSYDAENEQIITTATGLGTGASYHEFVSAKATGDDTIKVILHEVYSDRHNCITAKIVNGQAKFTSYTIE